MFAAASSRAVVRLGLLGLGTGSAATGLTIYKNDDGVRRSFEFWKRIVPIYAHYRLIQLLNRDMKVMSDEYAESVYEELHQRYSPPVRDLVYDMRGFYLKNAQIMSTQDDFVPRAYMDWVKDTQDNVPSEFAPGEAKQYVADRLKEEQGLDFHEVFSDWEDTPLGVASIGQVHKATLRKSGETVAVKLLMPDMERKFRCDIATLKSFCALAMPQHVTAFDEMEKQFCTEFDYRGEAQNLADIYGAIMPKWHAFVHIPRPHMKLCSKHLLVMEYVDGVKLVDGIRKQYAKVAERNGTTLEAIEAERIAQIAAGTFQFKSIEDSKRERFQLQWYYFLQDFSRLDNLLKVCYNCSILRLLLGPAEYQRTELPVDLGSTLELIGRVHADQIFRVGAFNADPHPGNILLQKDGRLGLIDYGQVKRMTVEERIIFAKLIIAHTRMDVDEVVRIHFDEMGVKTKKRDPKVGYLMSAFYNDRNTYDVCAGMNLATFVDWMQAQDPMINLPEAYLFASRVSIMLRGMGNAFGVQMRTSKLWEQDAQDFLKSQGVVY